MKDIWKKKDEENVTVQKKNKNKGKTEYRRVTIKK